MQAGFLLVFFLAASLTITGCASSGRRAKDTQIQRLKSEIGVLQTKIQKKEEKIMSLETQETQASLVEEPVTTLVEEKIEKRTQTSGREKTSRNIQQALKNANLYQGPIDGIIGKKTKKAIKDFQEANNLTSDGIVGKKTWAKLKEYL